jgi:ribonuclease HI
MQTQISWRLYIDGAARNNPGPAGIGIYLVRNNCPVVEQGFYVGSKTNNQAEYLALLVGLFYCKKYISPHERVYIYSDSQLLVRQLSGIYKIKNAELKKLVGFVQEFLSMVQYTLVHIRRENNTKADSLANKGIDTKQILSGEVLVFLAHILEY